MSLTPQARQIIAIVVVMILAFVLIMSAATVLTKRKKMSSREKFVSYNRRYVFYYDFWLTRKTFRKIHSQISNLSVYNFMEARIQTVKFFERSLFVSGGMFVAGFIGFGELISGILLFLFSIVMMNNMVAKRIDDVNYQCLKAISRLCSGLTENFTRVRNVPDALSNTEPPKILERSLDRIYQIVTANDGRERLETFFQENQNRELRTIAVICYLRNDIGEDGLAYSPFKRAIRLVKDEVDMEVRRQLSMRLMFKSLEYLPFLALACYPPLRFLLQKLLPATTGVFNSTLGYASKLLLVLITLVCYYTLSTINNASVARTDDRLDFIVNLLNREKIRKFARTLVPKSWKVRKAQKEKIDGCLSLKTLEYVALEKFIFGSVMFVMSFVMSIAVIFAARGAAYNSLSDMSMTSIIKYTADQERAVLEYQHQIMDGEITPNDEEIRDFISSLYYKATTMELDAHVNRIRDICNEYAAIRFRWFLCFLYIACWYIGKFASEFLLTLRSKLVESEAEIDILQLQTIIAILMDTPLDTLNVIYWLAKSSDIHADILSYCYHEYTRDPEMALRRLRDKSAIPEFSDMCDKLKTTISQVTLDEAFEDLIADRDNTLKIRETVQMESLKKKRTLASPIAKAPMMVWMFSTFMLPIVVVAVQTASSTLANIGQLGG